MSDELDQLRTINAELVAALSLVEARYVNPNCKCRPCVVTRRALALARATAATEKEG
jgi:DNA-binding transcriptional regulator YdaS (Cro superfamily)